MKVLACMEAREGCAQSSSLELLTAARSLASKSGHVVALTVGRFSTMNVAADRIVGVDSAGTHLITAERYAAALVQAVNDEKPDVVLCSYSALGLDIGPHLAAKAGWPLIAYCSGIVASGSNLTAKSQLYGGKIVATSVTSAPAIFVINPGAYAEAPLSSTATPVTESAIPDAWRISRITHIEEIKPDPSQVDISKAAKIVCVGRGIGEKGSIGLVDDLAAALKAEIAGSRPVVDSGWLPKERQVGKSGRKVQPKLYIAIGVSGAPEHLEGMKRSDLIIAVNSDPKAPIFNVAHYGTTCDLFDLIPALTDRLKTAGT